MPMARGARSLGRPRDGATGGACPQSTSPLPLRPQTHSTAALHSPPFARPRRYTQAEQERAAAGAGGVAGLLAAAAAGDDKLMHPGEERLIVAYLDLLT